MLNIRLRQKKKERNKKRRLKRKEYLEDRKAKGNPETLEERLLRLKTFAEAGSRKEYRKLKGYVRLNGQ